jgi:phosphate transport system substrate-binding protein
MQRAPRNAARTKAALDFFDWALNAGQEQATGLHYAALPANLVRQIEAYWKGAFVTAD